MSAMRELPPSGGSTIREIVFAVNQLIRGRGNNVDQLTLTENTTTTTVTPSSKIMNSGARIMLSPRTANAAAEACYVSEITRTSFTITHANNSQTDRTFDYAIVGG